MLNLYYFFAKRCWGFYKLNMHMCYMCVRGKMSILCGSEWEARSMWSGVLNYSAPCFLEDRVSH